MFQKNRKSSPTKGKCGAIISRVHTIVWILLSLILRITVCVGGQSRPTRQRTAACKMRGDSLVSPTPSLPQGCSAKGEAVYQLEGHCVWSPFRMQVSMSMKSIKIVYVLIDLHPWLMYRTWGFYEVVITTLD